MEIKINLQFPSSLHTGEWLCWRRPQAGRWQRGAGGGGLPGGERPPGAPGAPTLHTRHGSEGQPVPRGLPAPCPRLTAPPPPGLHSPRQAHQPSPGGDPDWAHWRETLGPHGLQLCTLHWGPGAENDSPGTDAKGHHTQVPGPGIPGLSPAGRAQGPRHALHPLQAHSLSSHPLSEPSLPRPGRGPPTAAALCPRGPCEWP